MKINILGITLDFLSYEEIMQKITGAILSGEQLTITYANKYVLNFAFSNRKLFDKLSYFTVVYPDGLGAAWAGKILGDFKKISQRTVATDVLEILLPFLLQSKTPVYFFGDTTETLAKIQIKNPLLQVSGTCSGFNFNNSQVISDIQSKKPAILFVGLGTPLQESWIIENKHLLKVPVIIAVGEGIRVFAGNKVRGAKIVQKAGLEWAVRLLHNPGRLWKRYIYGIPQFIFRVLKQKLVL